MILTSLALAVALTGPPPSDTFSLVAWQVTSTVPDNHFATPQEFLARNDGVPLFDVSQTPDADLNAAFGGVLCGKVQFDLYESVVTFGPGSTLTRAGDGEIWPGFGDYQSSFSKVVQYAECPPPKPDPVPYSEAGETFSCEAWTYWTKTGYYDWTLVDGVWVQDADPTVTDETSELVPTNAGEREARGCNTPDPPSDKPKELAETGLSPLGSWLLVGSIAAVVAGLMMTLYRAKGLER